MTTTTTNPSYELATKIIGIRGEIHSTKVLLHNASEMRDARGVGRLQAELDRKIRAHWQEMQ